MDHLHQEYEDARSVADRLDPNRRKSRLHMAPSDQLTAASLDLRLILKLATQRFAAQNDPARVAGFLVEEMRVMRNTLSAMVWQQIILLAQDHPINAMLQQDPFTHWSVTKPRGYSGDAVLMDLVYGHPSIEPLIAEASDLGRSIFSYTGNAPTSAGSRERRELLAKHVDEVASTREGDAEILSIAAGHLREAEKSIALNEKRLKRWVAIDQDPISVGMIQNDYGTSGVEAIQGSVKGILTNRYELGEFDLIYAAGLYDYLPHKVAVSLTSKCLQMLKPGGTFLFANYHSETPDEGYMEAFMDWSLILRTEAEVWAIIDQSVDRNTVDVEVKFGKNGTIVYAAIRKSRAS